MVVTQLEERWLLTPEVRGSNSVIGKILYRTRIYSLLLKILKKTSYGLLLKIGKE